MFIFIILLIFGVATHGEIDLKRAASSPPPVRPATQEAERRSVTARVKPVEELRMEMQGLVNVKSYAPDIVVQLAYASSNNILNEQLYHDFNEAYLQKDAALKLSLAQNILKKISPTLSIIVYDAARPQRIQQRCWEIAREKKLQFLFTDPEKISMHTYGVAIDVSLVSLVTNTELDMGGSFDNSGAMAAPKREREMLLSGRLSKQQHANRLLLREVMQAAGFTPISNEWWHFEACTRREAEKKYRPII
ncbi:MAG: M15 family metallopeptidase [Prevotellaceae bacterium]|jgi:D-alanyl-D-alanine dipeptidase|nr:M15 family metallopeptidase [Prevotellaceae bacterium]